MRERLFEVYAAGADAHRDGSGVPALDGGEVWVSPDGILITHASRAALVDWNSVRQVHSAGVEGILVVIDGVGVVPLPGRLGHDVWEGMTSGHHAALRRRPA